MKIYGTTNEIPTLISMIPLAVLGEGISYELSSFLLFVKNLPLEESLSICAKLNFLFSRGHREDIENHQEIVLKQLIHCEWLDVSDLKRMQKYVEKRGESFKDNFFFTRMNCIELIRWLAFSGTTQSEGSLNGMKRKQSFARAMLSAFEIWSERTQGRILFSEKYESANEIQRQFESLRSFRELSLWQVSRFHPEWQFGRANELFIELFFSKNPETRRVVEEMIGMSVEEYMHCVVALMSLPMGWLKTQKNIIENFEFNPALLCTNAPHLAVNMEKFLGQEATTAKDLHAFYKRMPDLSQLTDLRPLRERPILLVNNGKRASFLDEDFVAERCSNGLLFKAVSKLGDTAMTQFGIAFEEYSIRRLNRYCDSLKKQQHELEWKGNVQGFCRTRRQKVEFADYVILVGKSLILIEIKGKWLQDRSVGGATAEDYWSEIREKYVLADADGEAKRKGVTQLASSISGLIDRSLEPDLSLDVDNIETIIPVMLVYDSHLPVLFHGTFLAHEFEKALRGGDQELSKGHFDWRNYQILNLCLISINDFEGFENRVLKRELSQLLKDYSSKYPYRHVSAGDYLSRLEQEPYAPKPGIFHESRSVLKTAIENFQKAIS